MSGFRPKKETSSETPPVASTTASQTTQKVSADRRPLAPVLRKTTLLTVLVLITAWVFGVRLHPEALRPAASIQKADTVLELKSGQSVAGKIVSERTDSIIFLMEGSEVPFSRKEIKSLRPATPEEAALETAGSGKRPLITVRPEDTFQYKLKNNKKLF